MIYFKHSSLWFRVLYKRNKTSMLPLLQFSAYFTQIYASDSQLNEQCHEGHLLKRLTSIWPFF